MSYSMGISLNSGEPVDFIVDYLKNSPYLKDTRSLSVSKNHNIFNEYGSNGIVIHFSTVSMTESYFMFNALKIAAIFCGSQFINPKDGKSYPFYIHDNEICLLVNPDEYKNNINKYQDNFKIEGKIKNSLNHIQIEPLENSNEEDDDNIHTFTYSYWDDELPEKKKELCVFKILTNLLINEDKIIKEIFEDLKLLKSRLQKEYTLE